jgi:integral membrane protein
MTVLTAYRILAYVTGTGLILLVCVAMPLKYVGDNPEPTAVIGQVHGFLYALYALCTLLLAYIRRWTVRKAILVMLAGTVPFVTFYAERRVVAAERAAGSATAEQAGDQVRP